MALILTSWNGYSLNGTYLETGPPPGRTYSWGCQSNPPNPYQSCYWFSGRGSIYVTLGLYNSLSDAEKAYTRSHYSTQCVTDTGYLTFVKKAYNKNWYVFNNDAIIPFPDLDPCAGVTCKPVCVGVDRYATVCKEGKCVRGALIEKNSAVCGYVKPVCTEGDKRSPETCWNGTIIHKEVCSGNKWVPTGAICPTKPKPECTEGDKKPGHVCRGGKWVPVEEEPEPGEGRLYVKFAIPLLDMLPWLPYEPWMWIPPGFEVVEVNQG